MLSFITGIACFKIYLNPSPSAPSSSLQWTEIFTQLLQQCFPPPFLMCTPAHLHYSCNTSVFPRLAEYWKILVKQKDALTKLCKTVPCPLLLLPCTQTFCRKISAWESKWLFNGLLRSFSLTNLLWRKTINLKWYAFITKIHSGFRHISRKTTS